MRFYELELALLLRQECFDVLCGLVVHDVNFRFVPLRGEVIELHFVCLENAFVIQARNGGRQDCVCFIVIHNKKTYAPIERHERERSR